ncbi:Ribonuclease HII [bacterium HR37]|jgi:ribonuclease HII|nr:Ribonuclease HII [bacterium HR37]
MTQTRKTLDYALEKEIWNKGKIPVGVDEAGRGPLAGPVVAAAVILPRGCKIEGLKDSKQLPPKRRENLFRHIQNTAIAISTGIVEAEEIDELNILKATIIAMERAIKSLEIQPLFVLIDGNIKTSIKIPQKAVIKGDSIYPSIAAASIVAKVTRDSLMDYYHSVYPQYNFIKNKGYPTKEHIDALRRFGPCPIHRKTFKWVL